MDEVSCIAWYLGNCDKAEIRVGDTRTLATRAKLERREEHSVGEQVE